MSENWADSEESGGGTGMPSNLEPVWGGVRPVCREFWKWAARPKQTGPSVGDATDRWPRAQDERYNPTRGQRVAVGPD